MEDAGLVAAPSPRGEVVRNLPPSERVLAYRRPIHYVASQLAKPVMNSPLLLPRRRAMQSLATGLGGLALSRSLPAAESQPDYRGPNVILVRFGGGARPAECINTDPNKNFAPFLKNVLAKRGTLYPRMMIDSFTPTVGVDTSHGQGTMYLITGKYEKLQGVSFDEDFRRRYPGTKPQDRKSTRLNSSHSQ